MKIFYSWQSDLENKFNRGFIKECLKNAVKEINKELDIREADRETVRVELDHDTKGVSGTPNLAETIFEKIAKSDVFISDISFIATSKDKSRKVSNPNVLIELGYAINCLGSDRIVCVLNTAFGSVDELPFDLKHKRHPIQYCLNETSPKNESLKKDFTSQLIVAINAVLSNGKYNKKYLEVSGNPSKDNIINAIMVSDSKNDWFSSNYNAKTGVETLVFNKNVNLRFESGYQEPYVENINFIEPWANKYPDPKATHYWYQLYFGVTHIKDFSLISVDGGRALLPLPKNRNDLVVSALDYKVAKIHDKLGTLDEYMFRSGLRLEDS